MEVISRSEAKARGLIRYFTGLPCKYGHISERLVSNGCIECNRIANQSPQQKARRKVARLRPHRRVTERAALKAYRQRPEVRVRLTKYMRERARRDLPKPTRQCPPVCECCGEAPKKIALHLDHCHATGNFRGWLCGNCNLGLGNFKDSPARLRAALEYLKWANGESDNVRNLGGCASSERDSEGNDSFRSTAVAA